MGVPLNIDWQQILLHLFNFAILAGGLWLLLYKPVKNFMTKREEYYKNAEEAAKAKMAEAEAVEAQYEKRMAEIENEISEMKAKAVKESDTAVNARIADAEEQRRRIIEEAREAAQAEKNKILREAGEEIEGMVSAAIDKMTVPAGKSSYDDFLNSAKKE